jgi:hypothetical protein
VELVFVDSGQRRMDREGTVTRITRFGLSTVPVPSKPSEIQQQIERDLLALYNARKAHA